MRRRTTTRRRVQILAVAVAAILVAALATVVRIQAGDEPEPLRADADAATDDIPAPVVMGGGVVLDETAHEWNTAPWDQEKVVSYGGFQYTVFWDADHRLVLTRRDLATDEVERLKFTDRLRQGAEDDAHRSTQLGISPADGRLHLTYDHHNNRLRYRRSIAGFLTDPPRDLDRAQFSDELPIAARPEDNTPITYVRMFNDEDGVLYATWREGVSSNGDVVLFRYDAPMSRWSTVGRLLVRDGTYELPNDAVSRTRNAYVNGFAFDSANRLHVVFTWREDNDLVPETLTNHDISYAYSDDLGRTWSNNDGDRVADLPAGDPITIADPGLVVIDAPVGSWLMNAGTMAIDEDDQPHALTSMSTVETLDEDESDQHYLHVWRDPDGRWHNAFVDDTERRRGRAPTRGEIVVTPDNDVVLVMTLNGDLHAARATAATGWRGWRVFRLGGPHASGSPNGDLRRFAEEGVLTIPLVEGNGEHRAFALRDLIIDETTR